jgi:hypothetical protein
MTTRGRGIRFTAVLALVVLALTGFSRHGHSSRHGSGGGGCSSSHQDHDSSSSSSTSGGSYGSGGSYDDTSGGSYSSGGSSYGSDDDGDSGYSSTTGGYTRRPTHRTTSTPSAGGTGTGLEDGRARLISCATDKRPYATVEITNPNRRDAYFQVWVTFYDAEGTSLLVTSASEVRVSAQGKATARVTVDDRSLLASIDHCQADPEADVTP